MKTFTHNIKSIAVVVLIVISFLLTPQSAHAWVYVGTDVPYDVVNLPPVVNAGPDQSICGASVSLDGTATDSDGTIASSNWTWNFTPAGAPNPIISANTGTPAHNMVIASGLVPGIYEFKLEAQDDDAATASDALYVTVTASSCAGVDLIAQTNSATGHVNAPVTLTAYITNVGTDATNTAGPNNFQNLFQISANPTATVPTIAGTRMQNSGGPLAGGGGQISISATYTFNTSGPWYVRACADANQNFTPVNGQINETPNPPAEGNNCGAWEQVTLDNPTVNLTAFPVLIHSGDDAHLTWTSTNTTSCTSSDFNVPGNAIRSVGQGVRVSPTVTTTYQIDCTNGTTIASDTATVNVTGIPIVECNDSIDNADTEDTLIDDLDPGCWSVPGDPTSYDPSDPDETDPVTRPQCADGVDNIDAEDILIDDQDPGCWTDWRDPTSYDPTDTDEYNQRKPKFIEF